MAHRVSDFTHRHHGVARQFPQFPPFPGSPDDSENEDSFPQFPGFNDPTTTTSRTTFNTGPTVGPIIPSVGDSFTTENAIVPPVVPATTVTTSTTSNAPIPIIVPSSSSTVTTSTTVPTTSRAIAASANASSSTTPLTLSRSSTSAAASDTSTAAASASGSSSVGPLIGGIAAGIVGVIFLVFAITFLIRKKRTAQHEKEDFDASQFRRSAVLLGDPPTHDETVARGYNPPMTQFNGGAGGVGGSGPAVSYGNMGRDMDMDMGSSNVAGFGSVGQQGWDNNMSPHGSSMFTPSNLPPQPGFDQYSPMPSPVSPHRPGSYDHPHQPSVQMVGDPFATDLTREGGGASNAVASYPVTGIAVSRYSSGQAGVGGPPDSPSAQYVDYQDANANGQFVDMTRTSVTPFQAAQYKIISNKLNAPVPKGLESPIVEEQVQKMVLPPPATTTAQDNNNNDNMVSPFDDPTTPISRPISSVSGSNMISDFPAPPPPALFSPTTGRRIDSTPPMLPEIHVQSRITSMNVHVDHQAGAGAGAAGFAVSPSPLALGFDHAEIGRASHIPTSSSPLNKDNNTTTSAATATPAPPPPAANATLQRRDTMYDPEDAYGGM